MKNKMLKIGVVILLILSMTISNFIFIGKSFFSYAADDISTNHDNVKFGAYFKNANGEKVTVLEKQTTDTDLKLYLQLQVQKEGYFNGNIKFERTNFKILRVENEYVNNMNENTINLNRISQGETVELEVSIEPLKDDILDISLLDMQSEISLEGIYRDNTEKDISIKANKNVTLKLVNNINKDNIISEMSIITNKILKIDNEDVRVIQVKLKLGLVDNTYPIKSIHSEISIPEIDNKYPKIVAKVNYNNMNSYKYQSDNKKIVIDLKNENTQNNNISWKKQGQEEVVISYIYNKDVDIEGNEITLNQTLTLADETEIQDDITRLVLDNTQKDSVVEIQTDNDEDSIYKGNLYAGINREISTKTKVDINLIKAANDIRVKEDVTNYLVNGATIDSNTYYTKTYIAKSKIDKMLSNEDSKIQIYNGTQLIAVIDKNTQADENGNVVINYEEARVKALDIVIQNPSKEGRIEFNHIKEITNSEKQIVKNATSIVTNISETYNQSGEQTTSLQNDIKLEEPITYATLEVDKNNLSTVVGNDIEMKVILNTSNEKYDLYENPVIKIALPEESESIVINSVNLLYNEELKIKNYLLEGNILTIELEGRQTNYTESSLSGAIVVINANVTLNRKLSTRDSKITMTYTNANATTYNEGLSQGIAEIPIQIVSPTDLITIYSINELQVETVEQNETREIMLEKGNEAKQINPHIEIINSTQNTMKDVKIIGNFLSDSEENNAKIKILSGITAQNKDGIRVYYTDNENATEDILDSNNGWEENKQDLSNAKKYLITVEELQSQESVIATYTAEIPENLDYNVKSNTNYEVLYVDAVSGMQSKVKSSTIYMTTGTGPIAETTISAKVGNDELKNGDIVKAGEVIKYTLTITNKGTEDIIDAIVTADIPEGTVYVEPKANYEYSGSSYYQEVGRENYSAKINKIEAGKTVKGEYEVRVNKDIVSGHKIESDYKISYKDVVKESDKISLIAQSGDIRVSVKRITDRSSSISPSSTIEYYAMVENTSQIDKDNVIVESYFPEKNMEILETNLITGLKDVDIKDEDLTDPDAENVEPTPKSQEENEVSKDVEVESIEFSKEINIGTVKSGETKVIYYSTEIKDISETVNIDVYAIAKDNEGEYRSNVWREVVSNYDIGLYMTFNTQDQYVKAGDIIEYNINVKNNSNAPVENVSITDKIPEQCTIVKITKDDEEQQVAEENYAYITLQLEANEEANIKIAAVVNEQEAKEPIQITNQAEATVLDKVIASTNQVVHIIEVTPELPDEDEEQEPSLDDEDNENSENNENNENNNEGNENNGSNGENNNNNENNENNMVDNNNNENSGNNSNNQNSENDENRENSGKNDNNNATSSNSSGSSNVQDNNYATGTKSITGIAWYDENGDGRKDIKETTLSDVKVKLLNVETNQLVKAKDGSDLQDTTDQTGTYLLSGIKNGKYVVIFDYDKVKYDLTKYKASSVAENENSDVMIGQLVIGNETKQEPVTDIIQVKDNNIGNINIGLVQLKNFDLKLEKYISKISIQNSQGTTVKNYNNENFAKIELDSKILNNTNVVVEYKIKISNVGEIEGYVKKVVDYLPSDFKFSSEINKDWYQSGNNLYNSSLANEKIKAGEEKELTLIVTKTMTESNLGLISNTAEIAQDYNELGIKDANSTPQNRANGENDMSSADIIISIKTGAVIYYSIIIFIVVAIIGIFVVPIIIEKNKKIKIIDKI